MTKPSKSKRKPADRGLFERPKGSGVWWIRYHDENGREHREKVGPKGLARKLYQKRKTEIQERRYFPERIRRREIRLAEFIDDYLERIKGTIRTYKGKKRIGGYFKTAFGDKTLRELTVGDVERYKSRRLKTRAPATVNRELAFLKRLYNVAIADELVGSECHQCGEIIKTRPVCSCSMQALAKSLQTSLDPNANTYNTLRRLGRSRFTKHARFEVKSDLKRARKQVWG